MILFLRGLGDGQRNPVGTFAYSVKS